MDKTFRQLGYQPGDILMCVNSINLPCYKKGDKIELYLTESHELRGRHLESGNERYSGVHGDWEIYKEKPTAGKSDGGPSEYYDFPESCKTLNDLIEFKSMSFAQGNIFKAAYRMGHKEGITLEYDLNKIIYYANRMLDQLKKGG